MIWERVKGFQVYAISDTGVLKNIRTGRLLKTAKNHDYIKYRLCKDGKMYAITAHRLVATAFIPNPENKAQINHKNGIKTDNRVENLEWVTPSENVKHGYTLGLCIAPKYWMGKSYGLHVRAKAVRQFTTSGEFIREFGSISEAGKVIGISESAIGQVCLGKAKTSAGYKWEYKN